MCAKRDLSFSRISTATATVGSKWSRAFRNFAEHAEYLLIRVLLSALFILLFAFAVFRVLEALDIPHTSHSGPDPKTLPVTWL